MSNATGSILFIYLFFKEGTDLTQGMVVAAKSFQSYPTLCDPLDSSPPGSPVPGILQARTLEWGAITFSYREFKQVQSQELWLKQRESKFGYYTVES